MVVATCTMGTTGATTGGREGGDEGGGGGREKRGGRDVTATAVIHTLQSRAELQFLLYIALHVTPDLLNSYCFTRSPTL